MAFFDSQVSLFLISEQTRVAKNLYFSVEDSQTEESYREKESFYEMEYEIKKKTISVQTW